MSFHPQTIAARAGIAVDPTFRSVVPPLFLSTNFSFSGIGEKGTYDYTRSGNPTRDLLAETLAELEGGSGGQITSSGMSALTLVTHLLTGQDLLLAPHDCYGGTHRLLTALARQGRLRVKFVNQGSEEALQAAFTEKVKLILIETPSNPLLRVVDISKISALAHGHGAIVCVDNTFLSPALQRPLALGADLSLHSTTKYLNGHSDVVGGAVIAKDPSLAADLKWWANCLGLTGAPFDSFLTLRGLRTLEPRMRAHLENSKAVLEVLKESPHVKSIYYPGLESHPGHTIAVQQQKGFGGIISFELHGQRSQVERFIPKLRHFTLAESLGGVESLVAHPETMTHASMTPEARKNAGISDTLIRLSIGIEHTEDLVQDVRQALSSLS
jgi:cystathionine gamma-synthase